MDSLKAKSIKAFTWDFLGSLVNQIIGFLVSVILARLLTPEEFGLIGMVLVFTAVAQVFMDMGFGTAIVQSNTVKESVYSSVFWLNLLIGLFLTLCLFFLAKPIANFYKNELLIEITQIISLIFFISSFGIMQKIRMVKELNFKTQTLIKLIALVTSGLLAIFLSYQGFGVFALVYQRICYTLVDVFCYWIINSWRPKFYFKVADIKSIWGFSSIQFIDSVFYAAYSKLDIIMIGKAFDSKSLGFYTRAFSLNQIISQFTATSLKKVFFPLVSQLQSNLERVRAVYEKVIRAVGSISILLAGLFFVVAKNLFIILFTSRWYESIYMFKYLIVVSFLFPVSVIMLSTISGLGYPRRVLVSGVYKNIINLIPIIIGFFYGIESFLIYRVVFGVLGFGINCYYIKITINISMIEQLKYLFKPLLIATTLAVLINHFVYIENDYISLVVKSILFSVPYLLLVYWFDQNLRIICKEELFQSLNKLKAKRQ